MINFDPFIILMKYTNYALKTLIIVFIIANWICNFKPSLEILLQPMRTMRTF